MSRPSPIVTPSGKVDGKAIYQVKQMDKPGFSLKRMIPPPPPPAAEATPTTSDSAAKRLRFDDDDDDEATSSSSKPLDESSTTAASVAEDQSPGTTTSTSQEASASATTIEPAAADAPKRDSEEEKEPFYKLLAYYIKYLEKNDRKAMFRFPVTETIAPGYSNVITRPMDFATMRRRLRLGSYPSVAHLMADFHLICCNACKYNKPNTAVFKEAKRIQREGRQLFTPERFKRLLQCFTWLDKVPSDSARLNFGAYDLTNKKPGQIDESSLPSRLSPKPQPNTVGCFDAIADDMSADEILAQAKEASAAIAAKLASKPYQVKYGMVEDVEPKADGTVTLRVLNPSAAVTTTSDGTRQVTIGTLAGRVQSNASDGTGRLMKAANQIYHQVPREHVLDAFSHDYDAFASSAPYFDRREAVFTDDEIRLLRDTYGQDNRALQYVESMLRFIKGSPKEVREIVERNLNRSAGGSITSSDPVAQRRHSVTMEMLGEKLLQRRKADAAELAIEATQTLKCEHALHRPDPADAAATTSKEPIDLDAIRSLANDGIEVDFVDSVAEDATTSADDTQRLLNVNAELLYALFMEQTARLTSDVPGASLRHVKSNTELEQQLADAIVGNFRRLVKRATPGDLSSVDSIRKAMGLGPDERLEAADLRGTPPPPPTTASS